MRSNAVALHWIAIAALAVVAAIAVIWLWSELRNGAAERDAIASSVAELSTRLDEFAGNPAFTEPDMVEKLAAKVTDLNERISENSQSITAIGERQEVRASSVDARLASQEEELGVLKQQMAEDRVDAKLADLGERLDRLKTQVEGMQPALIAERLVALTELRRTIDSGKPFAEPLRRVREALPAGADPAADADWAARAEQGIPTVTELSQRLSAIARDRPRASPVDSGSEWVDSAVGTLLEGVTIGDGPALGDDPVSDAIRTAQQALADGDLDAAGRGGCADCRTGSRRDGMARGTDRTPRGPSRHRCVGENRAGRQ